MKNNTLSALVIFFAVVACLLILDDISYKEKNSDFNTSVEQKDNKQQTSNLATVDLVTED